MTRSSIIQARWLLVFCLAALVGAVGWTAIVRRRVVDILQSWPPLDTSALVFDSTGELYVWLGCAILLAGVAFVHAFRVVSPWPPDGIRMRLVLTSCTILLVALGIGGRSCLLLYRWAARCRAADPDTLCSCIDTIQASGRTVLWLGLLLANGITVMVLAWWLSSRGSVVRRGTIGLAAAAALGSAGMVVATSPYHAEVRVPMSLPKPLAVPCAVFPEDDFVGLGAVSGGAALVQFDQESVSVNGTAVGDVDSALRALRDERVWSPDSPPLPPLVRFRPSSTTDRVLVTLGQLRRGGVVIVDLLLVARERMERPVLGALDRARMSTVRVRLVCNEEGERMSLASPWRNALFQLAGSPHGGSAVQLAVPCGVP